MKRMVGLKWMCRLGREGEGRSGGQGGQWRGRNHGRNGIECRREGGTVVRRDRGGRLVELNGC